MEVIQLEVGGFDKNFSYIVFDENKNAFLIDAVGNKNLIENTIRENDLRVALHLLTHRHPDHTELAPYFKEKGIPFLQFEDFKRESGFFVGSILVRVLFTPGHTSDSVCFLVGNNLFTGDTLFVQGVGTTAYGGNEEKLIESLAFLSTLDGDIVVWPGHDYGGKKCLLKEALSNSNLRPSEETLKKIHDKVIDYSKNKEKKN